MFFKTRWRFYHLSSKGEAPEMRDDWETSSSFKKTSLIILSLWYYVYQGFGNVTSLENSDITTCWQLGLTTLSDNWNHLSAYVIWNILVLNIKGKVNKIAIKNIIEQFYARLNPALQILTANIKWFYGEIHLSASTSLFSLSTKDLLECLPNIFILQSVNNPIHWRIEKS